MADLAAIDDAIAALEAQRELLGDAVVDVAIEPLRVQREELVGRALAEQRKLVTVLFSDLVDFTVLSQKLDAEDVRTVIDAYFVRWNEHIEANGGVVEKFIGDAVMAVFGLHRADEKDAHRAIRAALSMRSSLGELNAEMAAFDVTLEMRVGIDTGDVVTSTLGDRPGQEFVVVGEIVNRASRLQSAAPRGGVLISTDTYRHVRGSFDVQHQVGLQLKGITEPVDAYLVQCERPRGFLADGGRGIVGVDTRTVGREFELRQLQDRLYEVADERRWQMVTIIGDAGVGKSRLLSDFDQWLDVIPEFDVWWFGGRAAHSGPSLPYALLHDVFANRFEIQDSDDAAEVRRKWERGVEQAFGDQPDVVAKAHVIGSWLGFEIGESRSVAGFGGDPQSLSGRATAYLGEYFRRLAVQDPVVLLLEDLHWADEATLALINTADPVLHDSPVLVVATARPTLLERHPHWGEGLEFHTSLPLQSLSRRDTRRLLDEILKRAETVPPALGDLVVMASEGNPFYVEELVNWFIEAGVITTDDEVWHVVDERLEQAQVPATLRSVLQARLEALPPGERLALQRASVIGRVFWDDAVEALRLDGGQPPHVDVPTGDALDRLRGRDVVYQREKSAFDHTREFLFKHALLRDVAYEGMLRRHRRDYHRHAAQWFERMAESSHRVDEHAGLIADHYANSGDREAAARWYLAAGEQAASVHGLADASRLLGQGLELVPASATLLHFDLLLAREAVLDRMGDRPAQQALLAILESLEPVVADTDPGRRVRLLLTRCRWNFHHSEYAAQEAAALQAIELANEAGLDGLAAEARLWLGKGLCWEGRHDEARAALDAAGAAARTLGLRRVLSESLRYLAIVASNVSDFQQAKDLLADVIAIHHEDNDEEGEAVALVQLASVHFNAGRFGDAREVLEQALPIVVASGFRYREAVVVSNLAAIVVQHGEFAHGLRLVSHGLELCLELDDMEGVATAYTILGEIHRQTGDFVAAERALGKALEATPDIGFDVVASDALLGLALVASIQGRQDEALVNADRAVFHGRRAESPMAEARANAGLGFIQLGRGLAAEAGAALNACLDEAKRLDLAYLVVEAEAGLARVALLSGDVDEARLLAGRVLDELGRPELMGAIQPSEVYRSCLQVLVECGDPRVGAAAEAARVYLESSAARIDDDELRESFLHNVPVNVELAESIRAVGPHQ